MILTYIALSGTAPTDAQARAHNAFRRATEGRRYELIERRVVTASSPVEGILQAVADCDMVVIGATSEPLFRNIIMGNVSEQVDERAHCPVIMVKRRSTMFASILRETILPAEQRRSVTSVTNTDA